MVSEDQSTKDGLDMLAPTFQIVLADAALVIGFWVGPAGLQAIEGSDVIGAGFWAFTGPLVVTTWIFNSAILASLFLAGLGLASLLVRRLGPPRRFLRAAGGLLGIGILILVAHALGAAFQFGGPVDAEFLFGLAIILVSVAGTMLVSYRFASRQ